MRASYDKATSGLDAPLAIIDLDAFDANADALAGRAAGRQLRVASKSVRVRYLLDRVLRKPGFSGLMCYSLSEALWLCANGTCDDLLVAYPTVDHVALVALAADDVARRAVTIMVDSAEHLDLVDAVLGSDHATIRVCLELDVAWRPLRTQAVHVGTRRSPLFTPGDTADMAKKVLARKGFQLVGLMAYEGQIAGLGDAPAGKPLRGKVLRWMQRNSAAELAQRRGAAVDAIRSLTDLEFVNGGGTGSIESTTTDGSVTEIAAGSGLIGPTLFDAYSRFRPRPAALYALPVVRRPARRIATLYSGGYVASGPAVPSRLPSPYLPQGLSLLASEGAGEVQTPIQGRPVRELRLGDRVWMRHAKAGELAERFDEYHVVTGAELLVTVPTYRGENQCFG